MKAIKRDKYQCFICGKPDLMKGDGTGECVDEAEWIAGPDGSPVLACINHPGVYSRSHDGMRTFDRKTGM